MKASLLFVLFISFNSIAVTEIRLNKSILNSTYIKFEPHTGEPDSFENALALNIEYSQFKYIRDLIKAETGQALKFLTSWMPEGEAHVTTISPPEYKDTLRHFISMKRINEIARDLYIQNSDLKILGIGSGKAKVAGNIEETFFIIVDSKKLRSIRHTIYNEFVAKGGNPSAFDPTWFFPHITIGYTEKDIHEHQGLLKDIKHSYDERFKVIIK
jgi:2'-5' RNA ligase